VGEATALGLVGAKETGVSVRVDLSAAPLSVFIDKIQIQQVVFNLVRNSVEAMTESPPPRHLLVSTVPTRSGSDGRMAEVSVSDTGPGLAQEIQPHLFEPFQTTKAKGMGLGLSICRSIIDAHGGRLQAAPNAGRGVTFRFAIPIADQDDHDVPGG
jgi:two-component system sensor kinase FixL